MPLPPMSHHDGHCIDGGVDSILRVHVPPGGGFNNFSFPAIPAVGSAALDFVVGKAFLALAPGCVAPSGVTPNADNGPGTPRDLWIGRVDELPALPLALDACGCGVAIFTGGSGGNTGDNLRMMRHLAANGYSTVGPDTMGGAPTGEPDAYPRHRDGVPSVASRVGSDDTFWCANELFDGDCASASQGGTYPACFSSDAPNIRFDPAGWAAFYERIYTLRARELDTLMAAFASSFGTPRRLFLHGNSEGAMVASRYSHPLLATYGLAGRILTAWSCEYNYFVSCEQHAHLGAPLVPVLNVLSVTDPFFGNQSGSVAADVAAPGGGWGDAPTGSCARMMRAQGVRGASIRQLQPYHDPLETMGSLYRELVGAFLLDPDEAFAHGVLAFRGAAMPNTLCADERNEHGVVSATCHSLEEYVTPQDPATYDATRCGWRGEQVRPRFIGFEATPLQCVGGGGAHGATTDASTAEHMLLGALLGALACAALGLLLVGYLKWVHRIQLFVRLRDEDEPALGSRGVAVSVVPPAA